MTRSGRRGMAKRERVWGRRVTFVATEGDDRGCEERDGEW